MSENPSDLPIIWIRPHYTAFNGIRAVAIILIFLVHFGGYILPQSLVRHDWVGVDLFFVLSGFLITGILLDSVSAPHYFRNFYVRRALRIFPLLYGCFLLLFILTPILHLIYPLSLLYYFFYVGNLTLPFLSGQANPTVILWNTHGHSINANIGHLWSICVEEQFYLLWPAVIWFVRKRERLMQICIAVCIIAFIERILFWLSGSHTLRSDAVLRWSTYTRIDTLFVGAWFALWLRQKPLSRQQLHRLSAGLIFISLAVIVALKLCLRHMDLDAILITSGLSFVALACAGLLLISLDETSLVSRLLQNRVLYRLGTVSYGFYILHHLFLYEIRKLESTHAAVHHLRYLIPPAVFIVSWLLAELSFRFFESPFLRLKKRFAPQWIAPEPATTPLHLSEPRPE